MIVVPEGGELLLISQPDHAHLASELLSLWRAGGLPEHPRRGELLFAVREHDNGWREADAAPRVDPGTGRPCAFLSFPLPARFEVWERGIDRFAAERPHTAMLIARHGFELHRSRRDDPAWTEFLTGLEERYRELLAAAGISGEETDADYTFLDLADALSLAACNRWGQRFRRGGVEAELEGNSLRLDPFPLAGTTTFRVPCRWIPDRRYAGDADLAVELARTRWEETPVKVAPGRGGRPL
jgi:hypothetical protein